MSAKDIIFDIEARTRMLRGMEILADAVRVTLGPRGRNVLLSQRVGPPRSTKDGVTVAKEIELADRCANLGVQLLREAASKTNEETGDGMTTAIVLAQALVRESWKVAAVGLNPLELKRCIDEAIHVVEQALQQRTQPINTQDAIVHVGTVASNGDRDLAELLATAMAKVGEEGAITIETAPGVETTLEIVEGMQFDHGYLSAHFVTDPEKMVCELDHPYILLAEKKLTTLSPLLPILESVAQSSVPLLIIAEDIGGDALAALVINKLRGGLRVAAVKAPGFGERRSALLDDLAALVGTQPIRDTLGIPLEQLTLAMLGRAKQATITKSRTILVGTEDCVQATAARRAQLRAELDKAPSASAREKLQERLAALAGGVAVLRIGGTSESEVKERQDRAEDALHAVRAAVAEGVVPGGGITLLHAAHALDQLTPVTAERRLGIRAVRRALAAPVQQIAENAGASGVVVVGHLLRQHDPQIGFDATTGRYVDMLKAGIIDPTRVVRAAVRSAGSLATLLISAQAIIAERSGDEQEADAKQTAKTR